MNHHFINATQDLLGDETRDLIDGLDDTALALHQADEMPDQGIWF
jgi:hypothetical protein